MGYRLVNLTGFHGAVLNDGFYTSSEAQTITVHSHYSGAGLNAELVFHQHITNEVIPRSLQLLILNGDKASLTVPNQFRFPNRLVTVELNPPLSWSNPVGVGGNRMN